MYSSSDRNRNINAGSSILMPHSLETNGEKIQAIPRSFDNTLPGREYAHLLIEH